MISEIPELIDGAKVLIYTYSEKEPFGYIYNEIKTKKTEIFGLAICKYDNSNKFSRFSCDKNWRVLQDSEYTSLNEAKILPEQYKNLKIEWKEIL